MIPPTGKKRYHLSFETTFPISFDFIGEKHNIEELKNLAKARPVIILEDWTSTGESAMNFGKTLSIYDVSPRNIACLVTNSKYFASDRGLNQLVRILQKHTSVPKDKLNYLVYGNFHDYLGQKISRFTFELGRFGKKEQFIPLLEKSVENYKQLGCTSE